MLVSKCGRGVVERDLARLVTGDRAPVVLLEPQRRAAERRRNPSYAAGHPGRRTRHCGWIGCSVLDAKGDACVRITGYQYTIDNQGAGATPTVTNSTLSGGPVWGQPFTKCHFNINENGVALAESSCIG